jgi:hypothetical protein
LPVFGESWLLPVGEEGETAHNFLGGGVSINKILQLPFEPENTTLVATILDIYALFDRALFKMAVDTFTIIAMVSAECQVSDTLCSLCNRSTASTISFCDIIVRWSMPCRRWWLMR